MVPVRDKPIIRIEITNACGKECSNCARFVGHHRTPYFMSLEQFEQSLDSVTDFPGLIGVSGGDPLLHPQFAAICQLVKEKIPPEKRLLSTNGHAWPLHCHLVRKVFGDNVEFDAHGGSSKDRQPMLLGIRDVLDDPLLIRQLQEKCWVDHHGGAAINPKGAFFCEVAAAMDILFNGPGGHAVEKGWWKKDPLLFSDQRSRSCYRCGACLPVDPEVLDRQNDLVSLPNFIHLKTVKSPKVLKKGVRVIEGTYSRRQIMESARQWNPASAHDQRGEMAQEPGLHPYGPFYGYRRMLKTMLTSRCAPLADGETALKRWLWRLQSCLSFRPKGPSIAAANAPVAEWQRS